MAMCLTPTTTLFSLPFQKDVYTNPSGALIKAVLLNGAQFLKGVDNGVSDVPFASLVRDAVPLSLICVLHNVRVVSRT